MTTVGDTKVFLQALIQVAAACVHLGRGNAAPGLRLLSLAEEKLERFGDAYAGVDVGLLRNGIRQASERIRSGETPGRVSRDVTV